MRKIAVVANWVMLAVLGISVVMLLVRYPARGGIAGVLPLLPYALALLAFNSAPNRALAGTGIFCNGALVVFGVIMIGGMAFGRMEEPWIVAVVAAVIILVSALNCLLLKWSWDRALTIARRAKQQPQRQETGALAASDPGARQASDVVDSDIRGLGGWLILVIIGLVLTPLQLGYVLLTTYWPLIRDGTWVVLTTPGTEAYHALWGPILIFELAGNSAVIILAVWTLASLLCQSRLTPRLAITLFGSGAVFVVADFFASELIPAVAAQDDPASLREMVRTIVTAAIWIPYFLVSERVKATFVR